VTAVEVAALAVAALAVVLTTAALIHARRTGTAASTPAPRQTSVSDVAPTAVVETPRAGEFTVRMGHELRTPLNSVIGFSSVLLKNPRSNLSTQQLLYISRIRDNGVHLLALVDHLLAVSDPSTGAQRQRLTPISVERVVRGAVQELASDALADRVSLETEIPADLLPLTTDEHRFSAALRSLVRGAYPLAGEGSLTVRVSGPDGRPSRIDVDVTGPAAARRAPADGVAVADPELILATSLYHLLGYPVTTGHSPARGATFSVVLDQLTRSPDPVPTPPAAHPH
jgi:signal transduction histidine kinase